LSIDPVVRDDDKCCKKNYPNRCEADFVQGIKAGMRRGLSHRNALERVVPVRQNYSD
jgi:hypothetical protein